MVSNRLVISVNVSKNARRVAVFLVCAVMVLSAASMAVGTGKVDTVDGSAGEYAPGELLVKFKEGTKNDDKHAAKAAVKANGIKTFDRFGISHWKLGKDMTVDKALKELGKKKYADVLEFAEPNYIQYADTYPTDSYRGDLWNFHNLGQTGGTADADVDALEVWDQLDPGSASDVVVAVIDTGVDYNHPDLAGVMWTNPGETVGDGIDNDGNGIIDDVYGVDFHNGDGDPIDDNGHGSHCSGVIAGDHDGSGVLGVAPSNVKIMAIKFLNAGGSGYTSNAIYCVDYAASFDVKVTSNSWGSSKKSKALENAIKDSGALFVASAGNGGNTRTRYPAGLNLANVVSVAATDHNDGLAGFSSYGTSWVDLAAPGVNILSCYKDGGYAYGSGTSMSCPHVAGAAALEWVVNPSNTISDTKASILNNVEAESSLSGKVGTGGKLNLAKMFGKTEITSDGNAPEQIAGLTSSVQTTTSVTLAWTAVDEDGDSLGASACYLYDLRYDDCVKADFAWADATPAGGEPVPALPDKAEGMVINGLDPGTTYTFAIKALDDYGLTGTVSPLFEAATADPKWSIEGDISPCDDDITYQASAIDDSGNPASVYSAGGTTYFTYRSGGSWYTETVDSGRYAGGGVDIAYDGTDWIVVYGGGSLMFGQRSGANSWTTTMLLRNKVGFDWKSLDVSDEGTIGVAYRKSGLVYAEFDGTSWTSTVVHSGAGARYMDLEFDSAGNPGIAYSDSSDNQWLDILMYVKRDASGWGTPETVLSGKVGYGVQVDLEFDGNDHPHMVCNGDEINYVYWDQVAGDWDHQIADDYVYSSSPTLVVLTSYTYICYRGYGGIFATRWDGSAFSTELVEASSGGFRICLSYSADTLHLGYIKSDDVRYAERALSGGPTWGD